MSTFMLPHIQICIEIQTGICNAACHWTQQPAKSRYGFNKHLTNSPKKSMKKINQSKDQENADQESIKQPSIKDSQSVLS